ncbi:hypothetical protein ABPG72_006264 [Tetrahymena utriculariae]
MQNSLIDLITEEDDKIFNFEIYDKFPYLKEEKQKFKQQTQILCQNYDYSTIEDEETQYSSENLESLEDSSREQPKFINGSEYEDPNLIASLLLQTSSNQITGNAFEDENSTIPNLNSQRLVDSPKEKSSDDEFQGEKLKRSKRNEQNFYASSIQKSKKATAARNTDNKHLLEKQEGILSQFSNFVLNIIKNFLAQNINPNQAFYGLDDCEIDINQLKLDDDGRISYKNKKDLKTITFLIYGFLSQGMQPSINFSDLVNNKNKECQNNLFIFFKWSDSSLYQILYTFLTNCENDHEPEIYKKYLKELLENCKQYNFYQVIIIGIYWLVKLLIKCIEISGIAFFQKQVKFFKTGLDTIIQEFHHAHQQAQDGGAALAEYINSQSLMGNLNIDFMGHSLGTVVVAYALKKLQKPARYLMLFGGAATITEIQNSYKNFLKCYNFYSNNDLIIKLALYDTKLLGNNTYIGNSKLTLNENFFNQDTENFHLGYMLEYQELYDIAMMTFNPIPNRIDLPQKLNTMKIGLGGLLLYLFQISPKNKQVSAIYLLILYIYQLFL